MIKEFKSVTSSKLSKHLGEYLNMVEAGEIIYIIRNSIIIAKIVKVDFRGKTNE